jgi:hypothetical protein
VRDNRRGHLRQKNSGAVASRETLRHQNVRETIRQIFELIEAIAARAASFIRVEKRGAFGAIGVAVADVNANIVVLGYTPAERSQQLIISFAGHEHFKRLGRMWSSKYVRTRCEEWPLHWSRVNQARRSCQRPGRRPRAGHLDHLMPWTFARWMNHIKHKGYGNTALREPRPVSENEESRRKKNSLGGLLLP